MATTDGSTRLHAVNVRDAKTHLSRLLVRVEAGEEILIVKAGRPVARLVPLKPVERRRPLGMYRGRIAVSADFDEPLAW